MWIELFFTRAAQFKPTINNQNKLNEGKNNKELYKIWNQSKSSKSPEEVEQWLIFVYVTKP